MKDKITAFCELNVIFDSAHPEYQEAFDQMESEVTELVEGILKETWSLREAKLAQELEALRDGIEHLQTTLKTANVSSPQIQKMMLEQITKLLTE